MSNVGIMASSVNVSAPPSFFSFFEPFDNLLAWVLSGTPTIVTGRTGTALQISAGVAYAAYNVPALGQSDVLTVGFAYRWTDATINVRDIIQFRTNAGSAFQTRLRTNPANGSLYVEETGLSTILGTSANGLLSQNVWAYIEVQTKLADTPNGFVIVKVNGSTVINATGVDTRPNAAGSMYDQIRLINSVGASTGQWDDLYLDTSSASAFRGPGTLPPGW